MILFVSKCIHDDLPLPKVQDNEILVHDGWSFWYNCPGAMFGYNQRPVNNVARAIKDAVKLLNDHRYEDKEYEIRDYIVNPGTCHPITGFVIEWQQFPGASVWRKSREVQRLSTEPA